MDLDFHSDTIRELSLADLPDRRISQGASEVLLDLNKIKFFSIANHTYVVEGFSMDPSFDFSPEASSLLAISKAINLINLTKRMELRDSRVSFVNVYCL